MRTFKLADLSGRFSESFMENRIEDGKGERSLAIIVPVFNDWLSFTLLLPDLDKVASDLALRVVVVVVDDGSPQGLDFSSLPVLQHITNVRMISLHCNLGHQRAIAVGLSLCVSGREFDDILVMDCDGEDAPVDIQNLLGARCKYPDTIVVASRSKRSEGLLFRICYSIYKRAFRWLTGESINFGNFCLIPEPAVRRLVHMAECWNHLAASIVKSRLPRTEVWTKRGVRYAGRSNMNLVSLVVHGCSAISVYSDTVLTRLFIVFTLTSFLAVGTCLTAIGLRLFTDKAIPGWATNVFGLSSLLFLQCVTVLTVLIFTNLSRRSSVQFIPASQSSIFVARVTSLHPRPDENV